MSEPQIRAVFDSADICLELMINHFDDLIRQAQQGATCTTEQIARWIKEREKLITARSTMALNDKALIEWVNTTYGTIVQAILQRQLLH
ncbi:hypothetical protein [Pseudomonas guineae]|uniref:hypothetical protein n=1 Tax=Pseudomonas guineae TaxID=425504 RepID=UPI0030EC9705